MPAPPAQACLCLTGRSDPVPTPTDASKRVYIRAFQKKKFIGRARGADGAAFDIWASTGQPQAAQQRSSKRTAINGCDR